MVAAVLESPVAVAAVEADEAIELSIVMPCLNEARTVGRCVQKAMSSLKKMGIHGEVIVADNGSSDASVDIARAHGARVVGVQRKGYGSALQGGIAAARGAYVIMGDADDSYDFTRLEGFVDRLRQGDDLVMGNRFKGGIQPGAMPWLHRYVGNPVLSGILNLFFHTPIRDAHCGLRGFRKDAYERLGLSTPGMEFASEMVVKASLQRQRISEVPTTLHPDGRDRPPHLRSFRDGWRHLRFLLLHCPLWLFLIPALLLVGGGLALMAWLTPGPRDLVGLTFDVPAMLCGAFALVLGYQVLWLFVFAKVHGYTGRMLPAADLSAPSVKRFNLERGLLAGLALLAAGIGLSCWILIDGPNDLNASTHLMLWSLTVMILGAQTIFGSFFLSVLGLTTRNAA